MALNPSALHMLGLCIALINEVCPLLWHRFSSENTSPGHYMEKKNLLVAQKEVGRSSP